MTCESRDAVVRGTRRAPVILTRPWKKSAAEIKSIKASSKRWLGLMQQIGWSHSPLAYPERAGSQAIINRGIPAAAMAFAMTKGSLPSGEPFGKPSPYWRNNRTCRKIEKYLKLRTGSIRPNQTSSIISNIDVRSQTYLSDTVRRCISYQNCHLGSIWSPVLCDC